MDQDEAPNASRGRGKALTMQDVAAAAKVSSMTVSNSFRHPSRVQPETRKRVLTVAAELGYVPNLSAGLLAAGASRVIGSILPSIRNSSFFHYTMGLRSAANEAGREVITMIAETPEDELSAVETLLGLRVAGIAVVGGARHDLTRALLSRSGVPVAESWASEQPIGFGIHYDVGAASAEMTCHLLGTGRRRIGFVGFSSGDRSRYAERLPAFRHAMFQAGLPDDLVLSIREADGFGAGPRVIEELLALEPKIDAILCPTDIVAAGAIFECSRRGLKVPDDIAVAGWGNYDIGVQISPALTTIEPNSHSMGAAAVGLLLGPAPAGAGPLRVPYQFLRRDSA